MEDSWDAESEEFFQHWTPLTVFVASVKCHLRYLIHCRQIFSDGLEYKEAVWAEEKHRYCSILQLMNGSGGSAGACPTLCGHRGSSRLCAVAAATSYFSPLWCFPPFCCYEFCCCCYKSCSFSNCLCPWGPRLPGRLRAGTPWHSPVDTKALQDKAKSGFTALQSLSITALEPVSTSQLLKGLFCWSTLDSCLDLC